MAFTTFLKNGALLPLEEAAIPLSNIEYAYGFGVYETIRVTEGHAWFLSDHIERLFLSASIIELKHQLTEKDIRTWLDALIKTTDERAYNLKVLLIGARNPAECQFFAIPLSPLFPDRKLYRDGTDAVTFQYERLFPQAKTLNMFPSYYYYGKAKAKGCYDCLFVDRQGHITEGSRTNFFAIRGKTIISPPEKDVLAGVMRKHVLECAKANGYEIVEEDIGLRNLGTFDGAFLTSTSSKIMPLKRIDEIEWEKIAPELKELMKSFDEYLLKTPGSASP